MGKSSIRPFQLRIAATLVASGLLISLASIYYLFGQKPGDGSRQVDFEVPAGVGPHRIAKDLVQEKLIQDPELFRLLLRITFRSSSLKAGYYELNDGMSMLDIARTLTEGRIKMVSFTIPEGWTNRQIAQLLADRGLVESKEAFLQLTRDPAILNKYQIPGSSTEGFLFPETYSIPVRYPAEKIQEAMLRHSFSMIQEVQPSDSLSRNDIYKAVILASIIEREAVNPDELPIMAGVYLNRLRKGMKLQADPTVQYLFDKFKKKVYLKDLEIDSPYNTYKYKGLPPGPISNPGRKALYAAFHPEKNDYLFFVLTPEGTHHFTRTYREHLKAKKKYIDGSSPI